MAQELLERLAAHEPFQTALAENSAPWLALTHATGAALVSQEDVLTLGTTPTTEQIRSIAEWLLS